MNTVYSLPDLGSGHFLGTPRLTQGWLSDSCQWDLMAFWWQPLQQGPLTPDPHIAFVEYLLKPAACWFSQQSLGSVPLSFKGRLNEDVEKLRMM